MMKSSEIKELSNEELIKKEAELREDGFRLRMKLSTGELEDTSKIKKTRKTIAKIKTVIAERNRKASDGR